MELSDTVKIVLVVASPIVFFTLLFSLAITYRRFKARSTNNSYLPKWSEPPMTTTPAAACCSCQSDTQITHLYKPPPHLPACSQTVPSSTSSQLTPQRHTRPPPQPQSHSQPQPQETLSQPHFSNQHIPIRRISIHPQQDTHQRINSIVSTLLTNADPSSEILPYGGRKSSSGSFFSSSVDVRLPSMDGVVSVGQRRPSVLSDAGGGAGVLDIRRVSVGGEEDVVRVRGASTSSQVIRLNVEHIINESSQPPRKQPPHPFSAASIKRISLLSSIPQIGTLSPAPRSPNPKPQKPRTMTLTSPHPASPSVSPPGVSVRGDDSAISMIPLKSPDTASTIQTSTAGIFEAWRGFPSKRGETNQIRSEGSVLSPRHYPLPSTPGPNSPLPPTPNTAPFNLAPPVLSPTTSRRSSASVPGRMWMEAVTSRPTSEVSTIQSDGSSGSGTEQGMGQEKGKRKAKVTYLADLVKEEEARKNFRVSLEPPVIPVPAGLRDSIYLKKRPLGEGGAKEHENRLSSAAPGLAV